MIERCGAWLREPGTTCQNPIPCPIHPTGRHETVMDALKDAFPIRSMQEHNKAAEKLVEDLAKQSRTIPYDRR